jgi:hypothetical protein
MGEQIKVAYTTLTGVESKAYVDDETLIGTDKHTDEPVELGIRYFEVAPDDEGEPEHHPTCSQVRFYRGLSTEDADRLPADYEYPCDCGAAS